MYSKKELQSSVYYPACGCDLKPLFLFSSELFIYADWWDRRWSATPEQHLRRIAPPESRQRQQQLQREQTAVGPGTIFRPATREEIRARILPAEPGTDFGFKGYLVSGLEELNRQLAPDYLEYKRDQHIRSSSVGAIGLDSINENSPPGFRMTPAEQRSYRDAQSHVVRRPWAREITLGGRIGRRARQIRLLYIAGEGIATYCKLYASQGIAPRVPITTVTGMGPKFADLENPGGIMARLLHVCQRKPLLWLTEI
jgi:hypothetical protein